LGEVQWLVEHAKCGTPRVKYDLRDGSWEVVYALIELGTKFYKREVRETIGINLSIEEWRVSHRTECGGELAQH
jgi:hypothetical protein